MMKVYGLIVKSYRIFDQNNKMIHKALDNYQTRNTIDFHTPIQTNKITIEIDHPSPQVPASLFGIDIY